MQGIDNNIFQTKIANKMYFKHYGLATCINKFYGFFGGGGLKYTKQQRISTPKLVEGLQL